MTDILIYHEMPSLSKNPLETDDLFDKIWSRVNPRRVNLNWRSFMNIQEWY